MQRGARSVDVFFSADDREECLNLLARSASKHALDFLAWCLTLTLWWCRVGRDRSRTSGEAHDRYTGVSPGFALDNLCERNAVNCRAAAQLEIESKDVRVFVAESALTPAGNVLFKLLNCELLLRDDRFDGIPDGNHTDQPALVEHG